MRAEVTGIYPWSSLWMLDPHFLLPTMCVRNDREWVFGSSWWSVCLKVCKNFSVSVVKIRKLQQNKILSSGVSVWQKTESEQDFIRKTRQICDFEKRLPRIGKSELVWQQNTAKSLAVNLPVEVPFEVRQSQSLHHILHMNLVRDLCAQLPQELVHKIELLRRCRCLGEALAVTWHSVWFHANTSNLSQWNKSTLRGESATPLSKPASVPLLISLVRSFPLSNIHFPLPQSVCKRSEMRGKGSLRNWWKFQDCSVPRWS